MKIEVKVPAVGESITEATIGSWTKKSGEAVKRNEIILLLETDKASVEVVAENDGILQISAESGQVVKIGSTVAVIDTDGAAPVTTAPPAVGASKAPPPPPTMEPSVTTTALPLSPAVQRIVPEKGLNPSVIEGTGKGGRLTKGDVLAASQSANLGSSGGNSPSIAAGATSGKSAIASSPPAPSPVLPGTFPGAAMEKQLVPMTTIRRRIAERLLESQQTTATLTTFNEIDMTKVIEIRAKYKDKFKEKYGVNLGFMGFFTKAAIEALKAFPAVNAYVVGNNIEYHNYFNIGIAVSTEKGLIVPVLKNAGNFSIAQIELAIRDYATKARDGKISIDDLSGGTFTITNGGVFGSLLSTPILNPPQSAILGMHKMEDRAVVIDKKIEVRTMMYVAMSYYHRIIDGKEAVGFLVKIKEGVEDPERLLLEI